MNHVIFCDAVTAIPLLERYMPAIPDKGDVITGLPRGSISITERRFDVGDNAWRCFGVPI